MPHVVVETGDHRKRVVTRALEGLGDTFVKPVREAKTILIKVDLMHHGLQLSATHVDAVRAVLDLIRRVSNAQVMVADAAHYGTKAAFRNLGFERLPEEYSGVTLLDLHDAEAKEHVITYGDNETLAVRRPALLDQVDYTISLAVAKTHKEYGAYLTIANWVEGTWLVPSRIGAYGRVWSRSPWLQAAGTRGMHQVMAKILAAKPPQLAIVDGILAMEGEGPVRGTPVEMGVVLAGTDPVAVDSVFATLMRLDPHDIGYLEMAKEMGLGENDMAKINVPTLRLVELARAFQLPVATREHLIDWRA